VSNEKNVGLSLNIQPLTSLLELKHGCNLQSMKEKSYQKTIALLQGETGSLAHTEALPSSQKTKYVDASELEINTNAEFVAASIHPLHKPSWTSYIVSAMYRPPDTSSNTDTMEELRNCATQVASQHPKQPVYIVEIPTIRTLTGHLYLSLEADTQGLLAVI